MITMDETVKKLYEDMCRLEEEMLNLNKKISKLISDYENFQDELKDSFEDDSYTAGLLEEN